MLSLLTGYHRYPFDETPAGVMIRPLGWASWALAGARLQRGHSQDGQYTYLRVAPALLSHAAYCHFLRGGTFPSLLREVELSFTNPSRAPERGSLALIGGFTAAFWNPIPHGSYTFVLFPTESADPLAHVSAFDRLNGVDFTDDV